VIAATAPESPYVLDGILGNQTDLLITEHATDTHGATLANFALFDLVDLQLSPRIRDLGKITQYRTGPGREPARVQAVARLRRGRGAPPPAP
jgi:TnpA family transposase